MNITATDRLKNSLEPNSNAAIFLIDFYDVNMLKVK